ERQQAVDELRHALRGFTDIPEILLAIVIERVSELLEEDLTVPVNAPKRRAEIVGDRIAERLQFPIDDLDFFFLPSQRLAKTLQLFVRLAVAPKGHLERREQLVEEVRDRPGELRLVARRRRDDENIDGAPMKDSHVQDAQAVGHCASTE